MMQYICSKAVTLVLLLSLHVHTHSDASSSNVAVNSTSAGDGSSLAQTLVLPPATKWTQCFSNGRLNTIFSVNSDAAGKVHAGLALPAQAAKCNASKPHSCKWLLSCDAAASCKRFFPGEMSGREKCLVVLNSAADEAQAEIDVQLQSPGNWGAIIFGVVVSSCGLLGVMAAGCYSDVAALLANSRQKQKQAAGSRRSSRAWQPAAPAAVVQQLLGTAPQEALGTDLHQQKQVV